MIVKNNHPISKISWLTTLYGDGVAKTFYEPESISELIDVCCDFYSQRIKFDLIGHTSNTLFTPDYVCDRMVSTRKLNHFEIKQDCIECECGTSVRVLSTAAIGAGIRGFEGLVDLPGTVASAVYGHATCFNCDLSKLLTEVTILTEQGEVKTVSPEWFDFKTRSSVLKRGEKKAVILSLRFRREDGDKDELKRISDQNHIKRRATQPEAKDSLGSIFVSEHQPTVLNRFLTIVTYFFGLSLRVFGKTSKEIAVRKKQLFFSLLNARDVEPYIPYWNWYQWKDEQSHELFWKYYKLHRKLFKRSDFEIEIKHNSNFIIPQ